MSDSPSTEDIGEALAILCIELLFAAVPDDAVCSERLEALAGRLLDINRGLVPSPVRDIITTTAEMLVKSEIGPLPIDEQ